MNVFNMPFCLITVPVNEVMQKGIFFNTKRVAIILCKPLCKITTYLRIKY